MINECLRMSWMEGNQERLGQIGTYDMLIRVSKEEHYLVVTHQIG